MSKRVEGKYGGIPLAERRENRRARLLAAAFAVYARVGLKGATVRVICAEAGLTPRYFYESFADSTELLLTAFDAALSNLEMILRQAREEAPLDTEAQLRAVLSAYYGRLRDDAAVARVFLAEMHGLTPDVDARFRAALHGFGTALGEIAPGMADAPSIFADGLAGGLNQIALAWAASEFKATLEEVVEAALLLFAGVRRA